MKKQSNSVSEKSYLSPIKFINPLIDNTSLLLMKLAEDLLEK